MNIIAVVLVTLLVLDPHKLSRVALDEAIVLAAALTLVGVGNLLVLVTLSRLLAPGPPRGTAAALLALGTAALLASDVAYDVIEYSGKYRYGPLLELGWLACFIACW